MTFADLYKCTPCISGGIILGCLAYYSSIQVATKGDDSTLSEFSNGMNMTVAAVSILICAVILTLGAYTAGSTNDGVKDNTLYGATAAACLAMIYFSISASGSKHVEEESGISKFNTESSTVFAIMTGLLLLACFVHIGKSYVDRQ